MPDEKVRWKEESISGSGGNITQSWKEMMNEGLTSKNRLWFPSIEDQLTRQLLKEILLRIYNNEHLFCFFLYTA